MNINKHGLLVSTAIITAFTLSSTASAQLDEVIVTSTKRETTLQATPVAVSVTSAEVIEKAKINDISDLQTVVPSLRVSQLQNSQQTNFIIRGFGNGANNAGIEPSVGVFIDGVYRSRAAARIGNLPKLQRIEVLNGPQSTLFGKNASAGVISIATAKPSFEPEGYAEIGAGNYGAYNLKGYYSTGVSENMAFSVGGSYQKRNGYQKAVVAGLADPNNRDRWDIRAQALFEPTDNVSLRIIADYAKLDEICCGVTTVVRGPTSAIIDGIFGGTALGAGGNDTHNYKSYVERDPTNFSKDRGISAHLDVDFENFTLTSISSYRKNNAGYESDVDFTSADMVNIYDETDIKTLTQEIRLTSTTGDKIDWMVGGYYFNEDIKQNAGLLYGADLRAYFDVLSAGALTNIELANSAAFVAFGYTPATLAALDTSNPIASNSFFQSDVRTNEFFTQDNTAFSLFGTVDFHVTDQLTLTGGLNYTDDRKTVTGRTTNNDVFSATDLTGAAGFNTLFFGGLASNFGGFAQACGLGAGAAFNPGNVAALNAAPACGGPLTGLTGAQAYGVLQGNVLAGVGALDLGNPAQNPLLALYPFQFQPPFLPFPNSVEDGKSHDKKTTWTARAAYEASDNINVYASVSSGFKSTSWNLSRDSRPFTASGAALAAANLLPTNYALPNANAPIGRNFGTRFAGPEEAMVYELGLKARYERAAYSIALFDQRINDFQDNIFLGSGFILANAGKQRTRGIEFDSTFNPYDPLTLTFAATMLEPQFTEYKQAPGPNSTTIDRSGQSISSVSKFSVSTSATYKHEYDNGMNGYIRADYQYDSPVQIHPFFDGVERKVSVFNGSLGLETENGLAIQLWARNIFNQTHLISAFPGVVQNAPQANPASVAGYTVSGYSSAPRTYGVVLRKNF